MKVKALIEVLKRLDPEMWVEYYTASNQRLHLTSADFGDAAQQDRVARLQVSVGGTDWQTGG